MKMFVLDEADEMLSVRLSAVHYPWQ